MPIDLNQVTFLVDTLRSNHWFKENYETDHEILWERLRNITDKQRRYLWVLILNNKYHLLKKLLEGLEIPKLIKD